MQPSATHDIVSHLLRHSADDTRPGNDVGLFYNVHEPTRGELTKRSSREQDHPQVTSTGDHSLRCWRRCDCVTELVPICCRQHRHCYWQQQNYRRQRCHSLSGPAMSHLYSINHQSTASIITQSSPVSLTTLSP